MYVDLQGQGEGQIFLIHEYITLRLFLLFNPLTFKVAILISTALIIVEIDCSNHISISIIILDSDHSQSP